MNKKDLLKGLTQEQIEKVNACKSQEELLALAKEEGIELSEEQLEAVNGGNRLTVPYCCSKCLDVGPENIGKSRWRCVHCGYEWEQ